MVNASAAFATIVNVRIVGSVFSITSDTDGLFRSVSIGDTVDENLAFDDRRLNA